MERRVLTPEERKECMYIFGIIESLGIKIGNPEDGGHWWNYDTYYDRDTEGNPYSSDVNPFIAGGPEDEKGFICRKWEIIANALYVNGYPCDLQHCIRYYVLAGIQSDWKDENEIAGEIVNHLRFAPECV